MRFSVSSYSLSRLVQEGEVTEFGLIALARELGFSGIEFAEIHPPKGETKAHYAAGLRAECARVGIAPVNYTIGADFLYGSDGDLEKEIERLKGEVDIAEILGVGGMRHDATGGWREPEKHYKGFSEALPRIIEGCRAVTEYAKRKGIVTMMENHGTFCQESTRVEQIMTGVGHENFGLLMDMGNFLCADEDPVVACGRLAPYIKHVHAKDFHVRSAGSIPPCDGFFRTRGGNYLRGAVLGHGDAPVFACLSLIRETGYDGFVSLEFEGVEEPKTACTWGLHTLKKYLAVLSLPAETE